MTYGEQMRHDGEWPGGIIKLWQHVVHYTLLHAVAITETLNF